MFNISTMLNYFWYFLGHLQFYLTKTRDVNGVKGSESTSAKSAFV